MKSRILLFLSRMLLLAIVVVFFSRRQIVSTFFLSNSELPEIHKRYIKENQSFTEKEVDGVRLQRPTGVVAPSLSPTPSRTEPVKKQSNIQLEVKENYQLEPCDEGEEEGCYMIRDAPSETMSTVEELNLAVKQYRKSHNFNELTIDQNICQIAETRAHEVDAQFSHDGFSSHVENGDYDFLGFSTIAENLWQGSFSAVHIVEYGWDKSDGHRANLQGNWSRGCAGIFEDNAIFIFLN
jgi:uncharacterized protein YkwD